MAIAFTESDLLEYLRDTDVELVKFDPNDPAMLTRKNFLENKRNVILAVLVSDHWDTLVPLVNIHRDKIKKLSGMDFLAYMIHVVQQPTYELLARLFLIESELQRFSAEQLSRVIYEEVDIDLDD
jgi:hypothetical protein